MSNVLTFPLPGSEALLDAIAEEVNDLCGLRSTRNTTTAAKGATTLDVESMHGWPTSGAFYAEGQRYTYTACTLEEITGISPPLVAELREYSEIVDGSGTFSAVDVARRMLFQEFAEEEFLDVLGRNLGVYRLPGMNDTDYRAMIRGLAYAPKGTVHAIEVFLTLTVGAGNFTIFEDLENFPNIVFITIDTSLVGDTAVGKSYFNSRENQPADTTTTLEVDYPPVDESRNSVVGVYLAPELHHAYFDELPSSEDETPWTYTGVTAEGSVVSDNGNGTFRLQDTSGAQVGARYERALRALVSTEIVAAWTMRRVSSSTNDGLGVRIEDGARGIGVGWDNTGVFLYDFGTATVLGGVHTVDTGSHDYRLVKTGGPDGPSTSIELWVDGVLVKTAAYSSFAVSANRKVQFGAFSNGATMDSHWSALEVGTRDVWHNYWNARATADGEVDSGDPAVLVSAGSGFVAADLGCSVMVRDGSAAHGRNNGRYKAVLVTGTDTMDLEGHEWTRGEVLAADRFRIPTKHHDKFTAEDAGVQATLTTGAGNASVKWTAKYGGDDGDSIQVAVINPGASNPSIQVTVVVGGGATRTVEVRPVTDGGGSITSTAAQVIAAVLANASASALLTPSTPTGTTGASTIVAFAATPLAGGEDGKLLTISGSSLGNDGTRKIATLIDERTVLVGSHATPAALTVEDELTWRKDPNFATETGLEWEVIAAGSVADKVLTLRRAAYSAGIQLEAHYIARWSAHILRDEFEENDGSRNPLYLADPFAFLRAIIDVITVAGVTPRYR